jgi:tetratricopeptide (TPR) repeat protein
MERLDDAVKAYRDLINIDAANAEGHNNLGLIYLEQGKLRDAANELATAVRCKPDYAAAHYNYSLVLRKAGDGPRADTELQEAYRLAPQLRTASAQP